MTLTYHDVRIGLVGVEASLAPLEGAAKGPYGGIGRLIGYQPLFEAARAARGEARLPWYDRKLKANRFWKKYATNALAGLPQAEWARCGWSSLAPLVVPSPVPPIHIDPRQSHGSSDGYVWPSAIGLCWKNWIEGPLDDAGLVGLLKTLRNGKVRRTAAGGETVSAPKDAYHAAMGELRQALWGETAEGLRSEPIIVVTIVRGSAPADVDSATAASLQALLAGIGRIWGPLKALPSAGGGPDDQTIYSAKGLRFVWLPDKFLSPDRLHSCGCLHRNLLVGLMTVEMVAQTAVLLAAIRRREGQLPPTYGSLAERTAERADFFLSGRGYSAPFLNSQLERGEVTAALAELAKA